MSSVPQSEITPRRRGPTRWLAAVLGLAIILAAVWFIRSAMWPCGALDRTSGCVSSVTLDVAALGFDTDRSKVTGSAFDLSPGGKTALVGIVGKVGDDMRVVLALYESGTGAMLRVLLDKTETPVDGVFGAYISEAALSPDGALAAAASGWREGDAAFHMLAVYRVADGSVVKTLVSREQTKDASGFDCTAMLDFSAEGTKLQCSHTLYDIATGSETSLLRDGDLVFPMPADFPPGGLAPDGSRAGDLGLKPPIELVYDNFQSWHFAPDSNGLLSVARVSGSAVGKPSYVPAVFRQRSAVILWDAKTKELRRSFYANHRFTQTAWSRDSAYFGLITEDLRLEVFRRQP